MAGIYNPAHCLQKFRIGELSGHSHRCRKVVRSDENSGDARGCGDIFNILQASHCLTLRNQKRLFIRVPEPFIQRASHIICKAVRSLSRDAAAADRIILAILHNLPDIFNRMYLRYD